MEYSQFEDLIMQTQCNETNLVTNAQTIILSLYHQNITHFVSLSIQTLSFHHNIQAQCFVLLKLRDGFVYRTNPQSILFSLPHEQISELRVCLSNVLLDPTANDLTKRLTADAIAEFGITSYLTDQSFWPDIVPFLLHVAHDSDPSNRKYALRGMIAVVYNSKQPNSYRPLYNLFQKKIHFFQAYTL
ncbi:hypothetical protein BLNAU_11528 [Blattamonas nauphoetae]|uniref:Uncharacterized protein n=1 Tax=Blattamonas nauphoetae TaxID=2049346 RepID=A0ABQ9XM92_9EUKA|nr:hypothetical protein BLNAU_11528 [Blattamonas nauphoetae]